MSTSPRKRKERSRHDANPEVSDLNWKQQALIVGALFVSLALFFYPVVFEGETYQAPDTIAAHSWDTLLKDAAAVDVFPLWNPYIFCGMPGYASLTFHGPRNFDLVNTAWSWARNTLGWAFLHPDLGLWFVYYLILGIGVYLLVTYLLKNWIGALTAALGVVYATYTIILVPSGHMTKIAVLAWFPFALLLLLRMRERFRWAELVLLVPVLHLMIIPGHVQFIFYIYFTFGLYFLVWGLDVLRRRSAWKPYLTSAASLAAATIVAFMMGADQYLSVLEYNPSSTRGSGPLMQVATAGASGSGAGLDYDYATNWSYPPNELMAFIIPSWAGFGTYTYQGPLTQGVAQRINTYFGSQPFTEAPYYSGIIILVLALVGFWRHRGDLFVRIMGVVIVLATIISFGKELPLLYRPMFDYFPMFNKFRVPAMILMLVQFFLPILAAYGAKSLVAPGMQHVDEVERRRWLIGAAVTAGIAAVMLLVRDIPAAIYAMFVPASSAVSVFVAKGYPAQVAELLYKLVSDLVVTEFILAALGVFVVLLVGVLRMRGSISWRTAGLLLIVTVAADLWRVSSKPIESHPAAIQDVFTPPPYLPVLQADSTAFRVLEFQDGAPPFNNSLAYWRIESAFGYQGAKMRSYQDVVDVAGLDRPLIWKLMNVKYIISNRPEERPDLELVHQSPRSYLYRYRDALPRAFFVDSFAVREDRSVLELLGRGDFDPLKVSLLSEDPGVAIVPAAGAAAVRSFETGINRMSAAVRADGMNLLFLSSANYPHGWTAYLDGEETPIYRANYMFSALIVPPGDHQLTLEFAPRSFTIGKVLSLGASITVLSLIVGAGALARRARARTAPAPDGSTDAKNGSSA